MKCLTCRSEKFDRVKVNGRKMLVKIHKRDCPYLKKLVELSKEQGD